MHSRYTSIRWRFFLVKKTTSFSTDWAGDHSRVSAAEHDTSTETKWQTFRGIPGFYSTSGAVDYTAVIFSAHLVAVKWEVFTTTSTREIRLCARPATQLTRSTLLPANRVCHSIALTRRFKWEGSILSTQLQLCWHNYKYVDIISIMCFCRNKPLEAIVKRHICSNYRTMINDYVDSNYLPLTLSR